MTGRLTSRLGSDEVSSATRVRRSLERRLTPVARRSKWRAQRTGRRLLGRKEPVHMLHISKTGGTALKAALGPLRTAGRYDIRLHDHTMTLQRLPRGEKVFFMLRDPAERYVSGFNDRLREGLPRYHVGWNPQEKIAFEEFCSADELALALSGDDPAQRARAVAAMSSIQHVRESYWDWLGNGLTMQNRRNDLLLVAWMPDLSAAFSRLCQLLELPGNPTLPTDEVASHRRPATMDASMSEQSIANLRQWFTRDYGCIEMCSQLDCFVGPSWTSAWPARPLTGQT